eukprot:7380453-Prymnesium_polylepis.1
MACSASTASPATRWRRSTAPSPSRSPIGSTQAPHPPHRPGRLGRRSSPRRPDVAMRALSWLRARRGCSCCAVRKWCKPSRGSRTARELCPTRHAKCWQSDARDKEMRYLQNAEFSRDPRLQALGAGRVRCQYVTPD